MSIEEKSADEWVKEGDEFLENDKLNSAVDCYNEALELEPDNPTAWVKKGTAFYENAMLSYAIKCFKKAIEIDPKSIIAKKKLNKTKRIFIESSIHRLDNSGAYQFIGALIIIVAIIDLLFFILSLWDETIDLWALFIGIITLVVGIACIGLTSRFKIIADYIRMKESYD